MTATSKGVVAMIDQNEDASCDDGCQVVSIGGPQSPQAITDAKKLIKLRWLTTCNGHPQEPNNKLFSSKDPQINRRAMDKPR